MNIWESVCLSAERFGNRAAFISGGNEVCRRGWDEEVADVVESIEALRRFTEGAAVGISDCLRFKVAGSWALDA